jgi:predicted nucleic-acid-binding protein
VIGLDSNIVLRYIVIDDHAQSERAKNLIEKQCSPTAPGFINRVVLCESVWTLERSYLYERPRVASAIEALLAWPALLFEDAEHVAAILPTYVAGKANFADLLVASVNRARGCKATATFDRKAARLDGFIAVP